MKVGSWHLHVHPKHCVLTKLPYVFSVMLHRQIKLLHGAQDLKWVGPQESAVHCKMGAKTGLALQSLVWAWLLLQHLSHVLFKTWIQAGKQNKQTTKTTTTFLFVSKLSPKKKVFFPLFKFAFNLNGEAFSTREKKGMVVVRRLELLAFICFWQITKRRVPQKDTLSKEYEEFLTAFEACRFSGRFPGVSSMTANSSAD